LPAPEPESGRVVECLDAEVDAAESQGLERLDRPGIHRGGRGLDRPLAGRRGAERVDEGPDEPSEPRHAKYEWGAAAEVHGRRHLGAARPGVQLKRSEDQVEVLV
jgi:hypothetical protein